VATDRETVAEIVGLMSAAAGCAVRAKAMFGGHGLYADDLFFAIIVGGVFFLKVDDRNRGDFLALGSTAFRPFDDEREMNYFPIPEVIWTDERALADWTARALVVAGDAKSKKKSRKR
jgi:DNA transformation protein and related proteins